MMRFLEHRIPPPIIGIVCIILIWWISRIAPGPTFDHQALTVLASILLVSGLIIDFASLGLFRKAKTTFNPLSPERASALVDSGFYKLSRNPMYLCMFLILTAWVIHRGHLAGIIILIAFVLYMNRFQIMPEERAMIANFGDDYRNYMKRVRRWI